METLIIKTVDNQTIMSQAWKETSLKAQRLVDEANGEYAYASNATTSAPNPVKDYDIVLNRMATYGAKIKSLAARRKKPSHKSNRIVTPTVFASMQNQVMRWGIPVHMAVISFDIWPDIIADTEFSTWFNKKVNVKALAA